VARRSHWRMRAAEIRALTEDMKETEPKAIMLRIADASRRRNEMRAGLLSLDGDIPSPSAPIVVAVKAPV